jgi:hypothetical protein
MLSTLGQAYPMTDGDPWRKDNLMKSALMVVVCLRKVVEAMEEARYSVVNIIDRLQATIIQSSGMGGCSVSNYPFCRSDLAPLCLLSSLTRLSFDFNQPMGKVAG